MLPRAIQAETKLEVLSTGELTPVRVWTSVLAVALNMLLGFLLKASQPPAATTTLLISLCSFKPTVSDAIPVVIGVMLVASVGEIFRRIRLRAIS